MQIVIDIPKEMYKSALNGYLCGSETLVNAIKNGAPLPKGHGRLGDLDALEVEMSNGIKAGLMIEGYENYSNINDVDDCLECVKYADTIIEAEKKYKTKMITRGNCMMCGKKLDEGLFFCKECEAKAFWDK